MPGNPGQPYQNYVPVHTVDNSGAAAMGLVLGILRVIFGIFIPILGIILACLGFSRARMGAGSSRVPLKTKIEHFTQKRNKIS